MENIYTLRAMKKQVVQKIGRDSFDGILDYVRDKKPSFWGITQEGDFTKTMVVLALFHDITSFGYGKILKSQNFLQHFTMKSYIHNTGVLRPIFADWALDQLNLGNLDEWNEIAAESSRPEKLKKVCLWIDSSDFRKERYRGFSKSNSDWSYKENSPGRRYMVLQDAKTHIRKFWGGYSPKLYDGDFLDTKRRWIRRHLLGAHIIGDDHFRMGEKIFSKVKFHFPIRKPAESKKSKAKTASSKLQDLTPVQVEYNKKARALRARVESPFGWIKNHFELLGKPWREGEEQMDYAVTLAVACYNNRV